MKIILTISLLLNALLIGLFAGNIIGSQRHQRPGPMAMSEFREIRNDMRENVALERARLADIMKAKEFNQVEFDAQLEKFTDAQCDFNREFMIKFNDRMQNLPVAERAEIIDRTMSRKPRKGPNKGPRKAN